MKRTSVIAGMVALGVASVSHAALLSWSATTPTVDGADIANFIGVSADADNIAAGDDQGTYVAIGRDAVGQTFTTGGNVGGYEISAITLQEVNYATWSSIDTGWNGYNGGAFQIEIGTISGGVFTPITSETAAMDASAPANSGGGNGSAYYATLTLSSAVALAPNTEYAFAVYSVNTDGSGDGPYLETNGSGLTSGNYTGGEAFGLGNSGFGGLDPVTDTVVARTGDRVFHADIAAIPEPATIGLVGIFGASVLFIRRRIMM